MTEDADRLHRRNWNKVEAVLHLAELYLGPAGVSSELAKVDFR
jgi:hypothetical protein